MRFGWWLSLYLFKTVGISPLGEYLLCRFERKLGVISGPPFRDRVRRVVLDPLPQLHTASPTMQSQRPQAFCSRSQPSRSCAYLVYFLSREAQQVLRSSFRGLVGVVRRSRSLLEGQVAKEFARLFQCALWSSY